MDIPKLSIMSSNAKLQSAASLAVTKLAMNAGKQNAAIMNDMLKQSVDPNLGNKLDVRA